MTRIFTSLSILALAAFAANLFIGLATGDHQQAANELKAEFRAFDRLEKGRSASKAEITAARQKLTAARARFEPSNRWVSFHRLIGVVAGLLVLLVNSITITYFVGTSRWVKEVVDAYRLSNDYTQQSRRIKSSSFPWSVCGMLMVVAIVAFGAAADPSGWMADRSASLVTPHYWVALGGFVFIAFSFWQQWLRIAKNHQIIDNVMNEVRQVKEAKAERTAQAEAGA